MAFDIPTVEVCRVYLILPDRPVTEEITAEAAKFSKLQDYFAWYSAELLSEMLPVLNPAQPFSNNTIFAIGSRISATNAWVRDEILRFEEQAMESEIGERLPLLLDIAGGYSMTGMFSEIPDLYERCADRLSQAEQVELAIELARILRNEARYGSAVRLLEVALNEATDHPSKMRLIGELDIISQFDLKNNELLVKLLKMKEALAEAAGEVLGAQHELRLAALLVVATNPQEAIPRLKNLAEQHPQNAIVNYLLGMAHVQDAAVEEALPHLRRATEAKHQYGDSALHMIGSILLQQGEYGEARKAFEAIVKDYPASMYSDSVWRLLDKLDEAIETR